MTQTCHIDPPEFTASDRALWRWREQRAIDPLAADLRATLGIAVDRPVIMTGHQAGLWHCGILAKSLAAGAVASRDPHAMAASTPQLVHLVVDQDDNDAGLIEYPSRDASGAIVVRQWRLAPHLEGVPTGLRPAIADALPPMDGATEFVNHGLAQIATAARARVDQPSLALQLAHAAHDIIADRCKADRDAPNQPAHWHITNALAISKSTAFASILERMLANPRACIAAYNQAASEFPAAGVRPLALHIDDNRIELPIWRITADRLRVSARIADVRAALDANNLASLAPKALLMTAFLRVFACDLFIHGTGGGEYDKVMERWLTLWPAVGTFATSPFIASNLAPAVVATATVRLPLLDAPVPTAAEVARARWLAHAAKHNPALLNDADAAAAKHLALSSIRTHAKPERLAAYRTLHAELEAYRVNHADELARLATDAARLQHFRAAAGLALRRTWPFPLAPAHALHDLTSLVMARLR